MNLARTRRNAPRLTQARLSANLSVPSVSVRQLHCERYKALKASRFGIHAFVICFSLLLILIGNALILQQTAQGPTHDLTIRNDALHYFAMSEGRYDGVPTPFRYRVLVPYLAGLLPVQPAAAFKLITYLSLFACYALAQVLCHRMGLGIRSSAVGLFAAFTTTTHLFNYHDPFLTDAFALAVLFVMMLALFSRSFPLFLAALLPGGLARESTVILVPVWLWTKQWGRAIGAIIVAVAVFLLVRLLFSTETGGGMADYVATTTADVTSTRHLSGWFKEFFSTWHFLWLLAPVGLMLMPRDKFGDYTAASALLFAGGLASSLIATDVARMFSTLMPVVVVGVAFFYDSLSRRSRFAASIFLLLIAAKVFLGMPTIFSSVDTWVEDYRRWIRLYYAAGIVFSAYAFFLLRLELLKSVRASLSAIPPGQYHG